MSNTLTCVYCGMAYPEGTPPYGAKILTDHIKICEKHPMREAEEKIRKLQNALMELIGASDKKELRGMRIAINVLPIPDTDKPQMLNAMDLLLEMIPD